MWYIITSDGEDTEYYVVCLTETEYKIIKSMLDRKEYVCGSYGGQMSILDTPFATKEEATYRCKVLNGDLPNIEKSYEDVCAEFPDYEVYTTEDFINNIYNFSVESGIGYFHDGKKLCDPVFSNSVSERDFRFYPYVVWRYYNENDNNY